MHDTMENFARAPPIASAAWLSKPGARSALLTLISALACWAQDPFSSLGGAPQTISTGTFVTGLVEFAIMIVRLLRAFSGRALGDVLIAIVGGGMLAGSAAKWEGWIEGLEGWQRPLGIHRRLSDVIRFVVFRHSWPMPELLA